MHQAVPDTDIRAEKNALVVIMKRMINYAVYNYCLWLWSPCGIGQTIIFLPWFLLLSSFFLSSPNLSGRRLDVCHTSTHGVALVRISDAGLKHAAVLHAAPWKCMTEKSRQKSPSGHHRTTCWAISSELRHISTIGNNC